MRRVYTSTGPLENFLQIISRLPNYTTLQLPFLHLVAKVILNDGLTVQGQVEV